MAGGKSKKTRIQRAADSIRSAFDFRDRNEPQDEPMKRPKEGGGAASRFSRSIRKRRGK